MHSYALDGSKVLIHMSATGVIMTDLESYSTIQLENSKGVQFMTFSPKGSYIITWERLGKAPSTSDQNDASVTNNNNNNNNLKIWDGKTGKYLHGFQMRNMKREQWPPIRWTYDENKAFHLVSNEIHVYEGNVFHQEEPTNVRFHDKIYCQGVTTFSLPANYLPTTTTTSTNTTTTTTTSDTYLLSTFVPETKGKPARISLLRYPDKCGSDENPKSGPALTSKSFYQAEECTVKWSPKGDSTLVLTQTSVDSSGQSYYGSTNLYLLLSESKNSTGGGGEALSVSLPSPGPVLDVAWMPNPNKPSCFAVISGRMPAMASLHHGTSAEPTFLFGNAHRNTIVWSDHGRFVTLGGFGNLAGGMDFYDRNKLKAIPQYDASGNKLQSLGNTASCAVGCGWSPCSRYFMVSTTSPRMNVDNGVRLYKYNGLQIGDSNIITWDNSKYLPDKLLAVEFVPALEGKYPDRPQTPPPRRSGSDANDESNPIGNTQKKDAVIPTTNVAYIPPAGRYVPPGARNGSGASGMSLAERMRKERECTTVKATKVFTNTNNKKVIPGMGTAAQVSSSINAKNKNQMRKERQRLAKQNTDQKGNNNNNHNNQKAAAKEEPKEPNKKVNSEPEDPEKRAKKIKKLLKQISDLKERNADELNDDQKEKINTEESLKKELASLNIN
jgi:translation initiation factor 2A